MKQKWKRRPLELINSGQQVPQKKPAELIQPGTQRCSRSHQEHHSARHQLHHPCLGHNPAAGMLAAAHTPGWTAGNLLLTGALYSDLVGAVYIRSPHCSLAAHNLAGRILEGNTRAAGHSHLPVAGCSLKIAAGHSLRLAAGRSLQLSAAGIPHNTPAESNHSCSLQRSLSQPAMQLGPALAESSSHTPPVVEPAEAAAGLGQVLFGPIRMYIQGQAVEGIQHTAVVVAQGTVEVAPRTVQILDSNQVAA